VSAPVNECFNSEQLPEMTHTSSARPAARSPPARPLRQELGPLAVSVGAAAMNDAVLPEGLEGYLGGLHEHEDPLVSLASKSVVRRWRQLQGAES
jgi:hypothetical protein